MIISFKKVATACTAIIALQVSYQAHAGKLFNVSSSGKPVNATITLCLDGKGPLSCQKYNITGTNLTITTTKPNHTYPNAGIKVDTANYTVIPCNAMANGYCLFSVSNTSAANEAVVYTKNALAYLYNENGSISACGVDVATGGLTNCFIAASGYTAHFALTINPTGKFLYLGDDQDYVPYCSINASTGALACTQTGVVGGSENVAFTPNNAFAYLDGFSQIKLCHNDPRTGDLTSCSTTGSGITDSWGIAVNPAGTYFYATNSTANTVTLCSINQTTGVLTCSGTTGSGFSAPQGITINPSGTFAYIGNTNPGGTVSVCSINATSGQLSACTPTALNISEPFYIGINASGTYAYVSTFDGPLSLCSINQVTGQLTSCSVITGNNIDNPTSVAILGG